MPSTTPNPMADTFPDVEPAILSKHTFLIAGILVTVFGIDELPAQNVSIDVCCLWLLHGRLLDQTSMHSFARHSVTAWNDSLAELPQRQRKGFIAVSFDQRNHGSRLQFPLANEAWRGGNPTHAPDMFSTFQGTAMDLSQLISHLSSYVFPTGQRQIVSHAVMGVSLGGYAAWHSILHDDRVKEAIIVVGCADYKRVMSDRARLSKRDTWRDGGEDFFGSKDFPPSLVEAVDRSDPAALLMGGMTRGAESAGYDNDTKREPTSTEKSQLVPLMRKHLHGKRILNLSGGRDKLVPYEASRPFLEWLKNATGPGGWFSGEQVDLDDRIYPAVGHAMSSNMRDDAIRWLIEGNAAQRGSSRI
ncbi:MAG: hypothetical protein M1828_003107 [Chrysothrix sp. TS-e1954]|nr:MAG: hypothetical protein M1828_003107 [Chrysothrix sp. TS-e1954]